MLRQRLFFYVTTLLISPLALRAQNAPVTVEAEAGTLGADWTTPAAQAGVTYITSSSTGGGGSPATAARVATYSVTFPGAGSYDLYARVRVGPDGANDDSFFYANSFGAKGAATNADWVTVNGLYNIGYTVGTQVVDGAGTGALNVWKWVNVSKFTVNGAVPVAFTVAAGALTQTFQIGAREDGLDIDKFVFGTTGLAFTVNALDTKQQGVVPTPPFVPVGPPLATGKSKYLGCAYSSAQSPNFTKYWNAVTPENGGKWGSVEATRGTFTWADLDSAYARATKSNSIFRMHNLIWGSQQPTWLKGLSDADQLAEIKTWFKAVADRYPKLDFIDVVNEPIHTPPTGFVTVGSATTPAGSAAPDGGAYINALGGTGTTGWDWIITSFQLARQYFPNSKLVLNEYSVENSATSAQTYATIVSLLKARGLIDGVGIQGHAFSTFGVASTTLAANLATVAAPGVPVYVTELDIDGLVDQTQLTEYQRVFPIYWESSAVKGITLWGYRPGHWRTAQGAPLVNADNTERPALTWLRGYVQNTVLGTQKAAMPEVTLYPNPTAGQLVMLDGAALLTSVRVLDLRGRLVQEIPTNHQRTLAVPLAVAPGLYVLQLSDGQRVSSRKLEVQ